MHLRRPGKRTIMLDHQTLSLHDIVSSGHTLDVELDGVGCKSFFHARALQLVIRSGLVLTNSRRKNLVVKFLQIVEPPNLTTLSATVVNKVTNNITNIRMILASLDHRDTISLLIKTNVLIGLKETLIDTVLTITLLKNTNSGEIPAGTTILLVITRSLVDRRKTIRKISLGSCILGRSLLEATCTSNTLTANTFYLTNQVTLALGTGNKTPVKLILLLLFGSGACTTSNIRHRDACQKYASDNDC